MTLEKDLCGRHFPTYNSIHKRGVDMKRKLFPIIFGVVAMLACGMFSTAPAIVPPTPTQAATVPESPAATEAPTATQLPTATNTAVPTATEVPVIPLTSFKILPQQWNGNIFGYDVGRSDKGKVSLSIEEVDGNLFNGKVIASATQGATARAYLVSGEIVTDFSADEKKWSYHPDYQKGVEDGVWLKLTYESIMVGGSGKVGLWWYAHISGSKMTGIIFSSASKEEPQTGARVRLDFAAPQVPVLPSLSLASSKSTAIDLAALQGTQQWNGDFFSLQTLSYLKTNVIGLSQQSISLIVTEVQDDMSFKGQMSWNTQGVLTEVYGSFVNDFSSEEEFELVRWNFHADYRNGDRDGVWVKWAERGIIKGSATAQSGWYYGHIRSNGKLVGIHFFSSEALIPSSDDYFVLDLLK
jgi:hypothetical protein